MIYLKYHFYRTKLYTFTNQIIEVCCVELGLKGAGRLIYLVIARAYADRYRTWVHPRSIQESIHGSLLYRFNLL